MARLYLAPAKINLTLEVLARREDGYHTLRSVMVPLALGDELAIEPAAAFSFVCSRDELAGDDNLVVRAARALGALPAARLELRKAIPMQAGLGGGSSDAAAVLRAAMDGAFGETPPRDWPAIARALGSDVPFFLAGTGALVEGTGERVTPLGALPPWHVIVIKPPAAVSTAHAYALLDERSQPSRARAGSVSLSVAEALQRGDFSGVEAGLSNDFQEVAIAMAAPIGQSLEALRAAGARNALLAGSGSCVFSLAPDRATIERIAERLALPAAYDRFVTAFAQTPDWRT